MGVTFGSTGGIWRYMLAIASTPAVVLWLGMLSVPESPRWLIVQGRIGEALEVLKKIREEKRAQKELDEIKETIAMESNVQQATYSDLAVPWVRRIVFIAMGVAICQQISGVNSIMYYGTQILTEAGFSTQAALIGNIANGVISVSATFFGIWMMGRHGRRPLIMTGQIGTMACLCAIGIASNMFEGSETLPYVVLCLTVPFLFFQQGAFIVGAFPSKTARHGHGLRGAVLMGHELFYRILLPATFVQFRFVGNVLYLRGYRTFGLAVRD